jgi:non-ribosomal peptide synthase protein (TIGR01720 family)
MRVTPDGAEIGPAVSVDASRCVVRVDVAAAGDAGLRAALGEWSRRAQEELDPATGDMVRIVWFDRGQDRAGRLLLTLHHYVVDGVSWRILVPDLVAAHAAAAVGKPVELEPVDTSLRWWALQAAEAARSPHQIAQLPWWRDVLSTSDLPGAAGRAERPVETTVAVSLPSDVTEPLLSTVPGVFHGRVNDVLLTGLALALAEWRRRRGTTPGAVLLDVEGHGREEDLVPRADLSRTVGWFTSVFPVALRPGELSWAEVLAAGPGLGTAVKAVKEQLRAVPGNGVGYGLLRYLNPDTAAELATLPAPAIGFNYLGRFDGATGESGEWLPAPDGDALSGGHRLAVHPIDLNAVAVGAAGTTTLSATWSWTAGVATRTDIEELAGLWFDALRALATHADRPDAGGHTPSDLGLVSLTQNQIQGLEAKIAGLSLPPTP